MTRNLYRLSVAGLALGALAVPAFAGGWQTFSAAFPAEACQDGWAACLTAGGAVGPGMLHDTAGRPLPSDTRLGWFDLQPTASFSPFVGLSAYNGPAGGTMPKPVAPVAVASSGQPSNGQPSSGQPSSGVGGQASNGSGQDMSVRVGQSGGQGTQTQMTGMNGQPSNGQPANGQTGNGQPANGQPTLTASNGQPTSNPDMNVQLTRPSQPTPVGAQTTANTTQTPTTNANLTTTATPATNPAVTPTATANTTQTPTTNANIATVQASGDCSDLVSLEPASMMGSLSTAQTKCLEGRLTTESLQTTKAKISLVLINNAEGKGDKTEWERLVKRHLEDIDRSDPDLCYKYSLQLSRGGAGRATGVIRWADYSLENKAKWTGNTYKSRVYALERLKTEAANKLWQDAEATYTTEHTDENEAKSTKYRGMTKDYAREWLDYAKASTQDTKAAMEYCVSAAGTTAFCEG